MCNHPNCIFVRDLIPTMHLYHCSDCNEDFVRLGVVSEGSDIKPCSHPNAKFTGQRGVGDIYGAILHSYLYIYHCPDCDMTFSEQAPPKEDGSYPGKLKDCKHQLVEDREEERPCSRVKSGKVIAYIDKCSICGAEFTH